MPSVRAGESRKSYISRCIPIVMNEESGKTAKQAAGKCAGMYDNHKKGKSITKHLKGG